VKPDTTLCATYSLLQRTSRCVLATDHVRSNPHGVCSPSTSSAVRVYSFPGFTCPVCSVFRVPLGPLDGFLPARPCRFCFIPATSLGFALRSLPLSRGRLHFSLQPAPTCPWHELHTDDPGVVRLPLPELLGFYPPRQSVTRLRVISLTAGPLLPWALPFQGFSLLALVRISPNLLPCACPLSYRRSSGSALYEPGRHFAVSIGQQPATPQGRGALLRVSVPCVASCR
jgi:hypothetical protein